MLTLSNAFNRTLADSYRGEFNVKRFGAVGNGVADDTAAIQAAIDAAEAYVVAANTGAIVYFPPGIYRISSTLTVQQDCIALEGHMAAADVTGLAKNGTIIAPTAGFADGAYLLDISNDAGYSRTLGGIRVKGLRFSNTGLTLSNTVHGIKLKVYRSQMTDVFVAGLTGDGITLQGYDGTWRGSQNKFSRLQVVSCDGNAWLMVGSTADNWFSDCSFSGCGTGYRGPATAERFQGCHWWSNINNLYITSGTQSQWVNCSFREPHQDSVVLDVTTGGIGSVMFSNCNFRTEDALDANVTYDQLRIKRDSGGSVATGVISNCVFLDDGVTNHPRYHINLSGAAAQGIRISNCTFDADDVTAAINHNAAAVRCMVNGLGINVGVPSSAGQWNGVPVIEGTMVVNTSTNIVYMYANAAWRALN